MHLSFGQANLSVFLSPILSSSFFLFKHATRQGYEVRSGHLTASQSLTTLSSFLHVVHAVSCLFSSEGAEKFSRNGSRVIEILYDLSLRVSSIDALIVTAPTCFAHGEHLSREQTEKTHSAQFSRVFDYDEFCCANNEPTTFRMMWSLLR